MWCAPAAGLNIDAHQPLLNHSLLSGLVPDGEPPSGAYDWSWKPMPAAAADAAPAPPSANAHTAASRATRLPAAGMRSTVDRAPLTVYRARG
jgi:hypothetical protein